MRLKEIITWKDFAFFALCAVPVVVLADAGAGYNIPGWFVAFLSFAVATIAGVLRFAGKADERYFRREELGTVLLREDAFKTFLTREEMQMRIEARDMRCDACDGAIASIKTLLMPRPEIEQELKFREKRDHDLANELQKHIILPGHPGSLERIAALDNRVARMEERQVFHGEVLHSIAEATNAKPPKTSSHG